METMSLRPVAPFAFDLSLRFLAGFPATAGEQRIEDGVLAKAFRVAGTTLLARVAADGPSLRVEASASGSVPAEARAALADRLRFWLGLDDDLTPFYALADGDPPFAAVVAGLHGYHQVKFPSPTEIVCWSILVQRTQTRVAQAMKRRIVEAFPENEVDGTWAFPDLDQLAGLDLAVIGHDRKAGYLAGAVAALAPVDEAFLRSGPYDDVKAFLLDIPGIGPWSALFVLIRGLGRMDEVPLDKEGLRSAGAVYGPERVRSQADLERLAARYGPWRGYWAHYLRAHA
jgi:DNA-3-methyladenine glycosylase II